MRVDTLKDSADNVIGYMETNADGSQLLRDVGHQIKGYYDADGDHTRDAEQNIVAKGNQLRSLIC